MLFAHTLASILHKKSILFRAAILLQILIAINSAIIIFNHDYSRLIAPEQQTKFVAQNNSSAARCKCQQNILTTEIKISN